MSDFDYGSDADFLYDDSDGLNEAETDELADEYEFEDPSTSPIAHLRKVGFRTHADKPLPALIVQ
jgi:hypothetical protein